MALRRLIVSADDFGLSPAVNAGIIEAHRHGILTTASLMVTGAAAADAVRLARATPTLAVGLHLVLVQGRACAPPGTIPRLVDADGAFPRAPVAAGLRYFFARSLRGTLEREVRAQLAAFAATGLPLSHVDGHLHIHLHPTVLGILLACAPAFGIRAVRLVREPLRTALRLEGRPRMRMLAEGLVFDALARHARPRLAARGIRHTDRVFGLHRSGRVTEAYLLDLLALLPPGTTELYCHPGRHDAAAARWRPPHYDPEGELAALCSPRVRAALADRNVTLGSYADLTRP